MGRALWMKIGTIVGLAIVLLMPLKLIENKIEERQTTRANVVTELAATGVGEQMISGPVLVVPCTEHYYTEYTDEKKRITKNWMTRDCTRTLAAEQLTVTGTLKTENRHRGIYAARFYAGALQLEGHFDIPADAPAAGARREWGAPLLYLAIRDVRGIRTAGPVTWQGAPHEFGPGLKPGSAGAGIHAVLAAPTGAPSGPHTFSFPLEVLGLHSLSLIPSARQHEVKISADWPHPSFRGRHLPVTREVRPEGFDAVWRISELASEAPRKLVSCSDCKELEQYAFSVTLIDPVDVYVQANRAVKYALLFVLLTFAGFFLFEILRDLRIHPVQYLLVGLALAMFFLLLIALSEHMRFVYAYLIAASACVGLIATYLQAVLKSTLRALGFAAMLTALYTMLYALLRSEDHSLLLGAVLVFSVLAAVMLLTRRIDWYRVAALSAKTEVKLES